MIYKVSIILSVKKWNSLEFTGKKKTRHFKTFPLRRYFLIFLFNCPCVLLAIKMVAQRLFPRYNTSGNSWLKSWMVIAVLMLYQCSIAYGGQPAWKSLLRGGNRSIVGHTKIDFLLNEIVPASQTEKEIVHESFPWVAGDETRRLVTTQVVFPFFLLSYF